MSLTVRPDYRSSQEALYTIAEIGWDACLENITGFAAAKPKYTPAFIAAQNLAMNPKKLILTKI
jgi:maltoporin